MLQLRRFYEVSMLKKVSTVILILMTALTAYAKDPKWLTDKESVYPEEKYISRIGYGNDIESAKSCALGDIASYLKAQVTSDTTASEQLISRDGITSKTQIIDRTTRVLSQMDLVSVDYSKPYYAKKDKCYYIVAFIDRDKAWDTYEPDILRLKNEYQSLYDLAVNTEESILRYKYLYKARDSAYDLVSRLYFGFMINPAKKKEFSKIISNIYSNKEFATLDQKLIYVLLNVEGDQGGIITSSITDIFSTFGFMISRDTSSSYEYILTVVVEDNLNVDDDVYAIYPYVEIRLTDKSKLKTFYTWNKRWSKTAAYSLLQCQKKSYPKIAEDIKSCVSQDYKERLMD